MPKYIGPFEVTERLGQVAYRLELPSNLKMHPVFHVHLLHSYRSDGQCQPPLPPESFELEGEVHWNVDGILDHKWRLERGKAKLYYLVHWEGFPSENDTWEPEANLNNCSEPLERYAGRVRASGGTLHPPVRCPRVRRRPSTPVLPPPPPRPDMLVTTRSGRRSVRPAPQTAALPPPPLNPG